MPADRAFVDTNVLVYAHFQDSDQFGASQALLAAAQVGQIELCVTPQIIAEFFAVITNPRRVTAPFDTDDALDAIDVVLAMPGLALLSPPLDLLTRWMALARAHALRGPEIFDAQIAATMQSHGVARIYTFDSSHFGRFPGIDVQSP